MDTNTGNVLRELIQEALDRQDQASRTLALLRAHLIDQPMPAGLCHYITPQNWIWANETLECWKRGPGPRELLVAEAIRHTNMNLPQAASNILATFERAFSESRRELTQLLCQVLASTDPTTGEKSVSSLKKKSFDFRKTRNSVSGSFVLDAKQDLQTYIQHHKDQILAVRRLESVLVVVDVLAGDGLGVLGELESYRDLLQRHPDSPTSPHTTVVRIVLQSRSSAMDEKIHALVKSPWVKGAMGQNELFVWFRRPPHANERLPPGMVYGNCISSVALPTQEDAARRLHQKLWMGEDIPGLHGHHFYFGIQGHGNGEKKVYNHFSLNSRETLPAMRETHRLLMGVHQQHWRATGCSHDEPGVFVPPN